MEWEAQPQVIQQMQSSDTIPSGDNLPQTVRFASVNEEIEPSHSLQSASETVENITSNPRLDTQTEDEIRSLAINLHNSHIQQSNMRNFKFEPCSWPASRVPSNESTPYQTSREQTGSGGPSPRRSPSASAMTTPPLTPHGTHSGDGRKDDIEQAKRDPESIQIVPQSSGGKPYPPTAGEASSTSMSTSRPSTADQASTRPTSFSQDSSSEDVQSKNKSGFSIGPSGSSSSYSYSRDTSPSTRATSNNHGVSPPPAPSSRPRTPVGEKDDPYARGKRLPQPKNLDTIDARFKFDANDTRRRSGVNLNSSANSLAASPYPSGVKDSKSSEHKKSSFLLLGGKDHHAHDDKPHGSMSDLKRFFGIGSYHHKKRSGSPAASLRGSAEKSGARTPPRHSVAVPFADDHGLEKKYGKFGKILGSGAGGSVRLLKRSSDGRTFAVKQFRDRHNYESPRDYNKKVTAEFCIGSTLHHGNIIETLDIVQEAGHWFEVMEYAPYDLFAIVMTGKMTREEITCCFLQIVHGVTFLHDSGLAHRDLKLDNVVVNEYGIMKIIDFGSASVFRYPFENDIILASGVVGSDPYLAPEVYDEHKYDPQPTDVWSLAIIFACMSLRRFPWKAPRNTDNSFKMFVAEPYTNPDEASVKDKGKPTTEAGSEPHLGQDHHHHHHHHNNHHSDKTGDAHNKSEDAGRSSVPSSGRSEVIRGPWRLLRLLPRETRPIIGAMLKIDPKDRATLADIKADSWVKNSPVCEQREHGKISKAGTHIHTLEPGSPPPASNVKT